MFALKYFVLLLIQAILLVLSVDSAVLGCQSDEKLARLDRCPALYNSSLSKRIRTEYGIDVRRIPLWNQWICCPKPGNELPDTDVCGQSPAFFRIKNGTQAQPNGFPWMAMLIYKNDTSLIFESSCAGSLINHRYVLTAAHCVSNMPDYYSLEFVRLGEHDITYNPINKIYRDVNVEEIIPYQADSRPYRVEITPICVLENPYIAPNFVIAGWGKMENGEHSNVLMRGNIMKTNSEKCKRRYIIEGFNDSVQICAGGQTGVDTCTGDSGSPLMASKGRMDKDYTYVAGITSLGSTKCGKIGTPSVYTRTSAFFDWIVSNLRL
ncbi:melanization protease 1 [Drosophila eugracilis]|uniref:melanization protease 1 n=1 Tax=Drosophila eugracilis TaxID=29029 RepID=UPI001BDA1FC8|nr:melanization protease 1 [Drosophila eugracilis]